MIRIRSLHKYFNRHRPNQIHVLNDINLELPESGMVAVFGKSGCGKTTLLNVVGGLDGVAGGSVTVDGKSVLRNCDALRNRYMGYIFQNYNLNKQISVFDNVADALRLCGVTDKTEIQQRVLAALTNVGMEKYRHRTPDCLSGGQQQRVAIARAIVKNPRIILADEPTGNLDEANTVMIMDLLREIAKDHLVLLVTHEANLVDYYCDRVIELKDGQVVSDRQNDVTGGYTVRDKNDIYLGELEQSQAGNDRAAVTYYGDAPTSPIQVTVVSHGGKTYLRVDTPGVRVLDSGSEIRLREGTFETKARGNEVSQHIDMSALPPVKGGRFGRLFNARSAVRSGWRANFSNSKVGKKLLHACMALFAAVLVLVTSFFATSIQSLFDVNASYNHNVLYVYTPDGDFSKDLLAAVGDENSGIDYVRLVERYGNPKDQDVSFQASFFDSFNSDYNSAATLSANAVLLDRSLAGDLPLVCGTNEKLTERDVLITSRVADTLLDDAGLGYVTSYEDLIGMMTTWMLSVNDRSLRIAGVVKSNETAMYLSEMAMASYVLENSQLKVSAADGTAFGVSVDRGQVVLLTTSSSLSYPSVGETIQIGGMPFYVADHIAKSENYEDYLARAEIKKLTPEEYALFAETQQYASYDDYYYAELEDYLAQMYQFDGQDINLFLAVEKGEDVGGYQYLINCGEGNAAYYLAAKWYAAEHNLTDLTEVDQYTLDDAVNAAYKMLLIEHEDTFYSEPHSYIWGSQYLMHPEDCVQLSRVTGPTHASVMSESVYYGEDKTGEMGVDKTPSGYTLVHATNVKKARAYLEEKIEEHGIVAPERYELLETPSDVRAQLIANQLPGIVTNLVTLTIFLVAMCVCMYFIMRSAVMNRVKEIGVYRAIGVSRKNLVFRFFVETWVLILPTVFTGYLVCSILMRAWLTMSPMMEAVLYYPLWIAVLLLILLLAVCLLFGILPICILLRKTPAQILAKYDI